MSTKHTLESGIRDNQSRGSAGGYVAENLSAETELSIVSAYFTIHAYGALQRGLEQIKQLRFLFGDPSFLGGMDKTQKASKEFGLTDKGLTLNNQLGQSKLARDCARWIEEKAEIRSMKRAGLLHGKMYHMQNGAAAHALLGSSNFTVAGLGLGERGNNVELNLVVDGSRDRDDLLAWFNDWWRDEEQSEDVKKEVLRELKSLYKNQDPDFIYHLTLFHIFKDFIDEGKITGDELNNIKLPDTQIWQKLFAFQKDGTKAAINKIRRLNGCILADSVGLGKTYTALAVIKYFELANERVLVLCPKKLRRNWTIYRENSRLNPFQKDRFRYDVLSHTDLSRAEGYTGDIDLAAFNWSSHHLVVIDESHNFRNNAKAVKNDGDQPRRTRYERLIDEIIKSGINTKILLLSATPVNNELSDLRNQLSFIAGGDVTRDAEADGAFHNKLALSSVKETTHKAQKEFTAWAKKDPDDRTSRDLLHAIGGDFFKLLDGLSIARSRKQIRRHYDREMEKLGGFPHRATPQSLHPHIDSEAEYLSFEALDEAINELKLVLYHPTHYLRADLPEKIIQSYQKKTFSGFTQEGREIILISMMKTNFLKRLESSVYSFRRTLKRTIEKIDKLEEKFSSFEAHQADGAEIDYDAILPENLDDPEIEGREFMAGGKRKFHLGHIDIDKWRPKIQKDREKLQSLLDKMTVITVERDQKLAELRERINAKIAQPTTDKDGRQNHKVLIFTAFADTAKYLHDNLIEGLQKQGVHAALITGGGDNKTTLGKKDYDHILTNFSPRAKNRAEQPSFPQDEEIDVLIATDCISEGQNLQDCDLLINYDIHWNPVRIIQRFGRIDRIGSRNKEVRLINFWPVQDLDRYLNVKHRVEARMALVDMSATQTDNLLEDEQLKDLVTRDLRFRDDQLKRLKDEILDLEDFDDNVNLSDFSLDEFRLDLMKFLEARRAELEAANPGLYAVAPPAGDAIVQPGVLFCLRHRQPEDTDGAAPQRSKSGAARINPLWPYYLVYVLDDGTARLGFAQPKQILNLFRGLAAGHDEAFKELCVIFDEQTQNGADMSRYNELAQKALASITHTFSKRSTSALLSGRDGKLPKSGESPTQQEEDYELMTWLVILCNTN